MKKTWDLINELRGKTKNSIKSCFKIDGNLIEDKREIANGFNNFFSSIARNHPSLLIILINEFVVVYFFINVVEVKFVKLSKNFRVIRLVTYL